MAAETAFVLRRDIKDPETGKRGGGNATAFKMNRKWEMFAEDKEWKPRLENIPISLPINREFGNGMHTSMKNVSVTLPLWDELDGRENILAPYAKSAVRLKKGLEKVEPRNESNKLARRKRTKPSEMTADDHARKRRKTKGISARNILGELVKNGWLGGSFETKNSFERV